MNNKNKDEDLKNAQMEAFLNLIDEENEIERAVQPKKKAKIEAKTQQEREFLKLIPNIHYSLVLWKVQKQFNNSFSDYIKKHKLFLELFDVEKKRICDDSYKVDENTARDYKKQIKYNILWSAQLLGLVGKNGKSYVTNQMAQMYKDDIKKQEDFLLGYRLINSKGKFFKLQTIEQKQRRKNAQLLNLSSCLSKMAQEKGFTWLMITYTLPASFHANPTRGANSYNGIKPQEAKKTIDNYWAKTMALLAKRGLRANVSYFGCGVFEVHKDSTLHKHCLIYIDESNIDLVKNVVNQVALSSTEKVNFDVVENGIKKIKNKKTGKITYKEVEKVQGATYIYKYIMKFNNVYTDDGTLKNQAARYFYSARGYNFFGIKLGLTKFNFIIENYKNYAEYLSSDLVEILETYNYYEFQKHYADDFNLVRNDKNIVLFAEYNLSGNNKTIISGDEIFKSKIEYYDLSIKEKRKIIIRKKIFSIFEVTQDFYSDDNKIESIEDIDIEKLEYKNIKSAFNTVKIDEEHYNNFINEYINKSSNEYIDEEVNSNYYYQLKSNDFNVVRVKQSYSRKYKLPETIYISVLTQQALKELET